MPHTLTVAVQPPYPVYLGTGLLDRLPALLRSHFPRAGRFVLVTDSKVARFHLPAVQSLLSRARLRSSCYVFPQGEASKTWETLGLLLGFLATEGLHRGDVLISLGGGVCGDLTGFAAACYMRGLPYVQIPTTVLAGIDASVGGKTAVDLPQGKNLAGAFHQPAFVLIDPRLWQTLPLAEWTNALGEGLKYALLCGGALYTRLAAGDLDSLRQDPAAVETFVYECVAYKARIVAADEKESGCRKLLNLGHSLGHAVELLSQYRLPHGLCVAPGLALASRLSLARGYISEGAHEEVLALLRRYGLPTESPYPVAELLPLLDRDKKARAGGLDFVTYHGPGDCRVEALSTADLARAFLS